uniref:Uncharacterized protein n=1 Tax=Panagrellus redivivus TaxID=6233 RepID=A0A7E4VG02_PANRE
MEAVHNRDGAKNTDVNERVVHFPCAAVSSGAAAAGSKQCFPRTSCQPARQRNVANANHPSIVEENKQQVDRIAAERRFRSSERTEGNIQMIRPPSRASYQLLFLRQ